MCASSLSHRYQNRRSEFESMRWQRGLIQGKDVETVDFAFVFVVSFMKGSGTTIGSRSGTVQNARIPPVVYPGNIPQQCGVAGSNPARRIETRGVSNNEA